MSFGGKIKALAPIFLEKKKLGNEDVEFEPSPYLISDCHDQ
jgi:hypothetical protein